MVMPVWFKLAAGGLGKEYYSTVNVTEAEGPSSS